MSERKEKPKKVSTTCKCMTVKKSRCKRKSIAGSPYCTSHAKKCPVQCQTLKKNQCKRFASNAILNIVTASHLIADRLAYFKECVRSVYDAIQDTTSVHYMSISLEKDICVHDLTNFLDVHQVKYKLHRKQKRQFEHFRYLFLESPFTKELSIGHVMFIDDDDIILRMPTISFDYDFISAPAYAMTVHTPYGQEYDVTDAKKIHDFSGSIVRTRYVLDYLNEMDDKPSTIEDISFVRMLKTTNVLWLTEPFIIYRQHSSKPWLEDECGIKSHYDVGHHFSVTCYCDGSCEMYLETLTWKIPKGSSVQVIDGKLYHHGKQLPWDLFERKLRTDFIK